MLGIKYILALDIFMKVIVGKVLYKPNNTFGYEFPLKQFHLDEKIALLRHPYHANRSDKTGANLLARKLSLSIVVDLSSHKQLRKKTTFRAETYLPEIKCDDLEAVENLCPIDANVQIDYYYAKNKVKTRSGHVCTTYHDPEGECIVTVSEEGRSVQGIKKLPSGKSIDFMVTACGSSQNDLASESDERCAYINDNEATPMCEVLTPSFEFTGSKKLRHKPSLNDLAQDTVNIDIISHDDIPLPKPISSPNFGRSLDAEGVELWKDCYPGAKDLHAFYIGISIGSELFAGDIIKSDIDNAMKWIEAIVADANTIYVRQLNVKLTVKHVEILDPKARSSIEWDNDECALGTVDGLERYRKSIRPSFQGIWVYIDDCYEEPDAAGASYKGTLCTENYNVALMNLPSVAKAWLTFAHEMGHSFGASHTFEEGATKTGGIMDYGDRLINNEYQFNTQYRKEEICNQIQIGRQNCPEFWTDIGDSGFCGNGVIEIGEQCECMLGSISCHCCNNCRLRENAQCDPIHNECCKSSCIFKDTTGTCSFSDGLGFCRNGVCTNPSCKEYGGTNFCGVHVQNSCKVKCEFFGTCYDMEGWTNTMTNSPLNHVRSGSYCLDIEGRPGSCQNGECIAY